MREKVFTQIRVDADDYKLIREMAHKQDKSINSIMCEGIKKLLKSKKKMLQDVNIGDTIVT